MPHTKEILPAVAAVIFNDKGEVLLQRRKDVDQWCILSGHVEFGESITEAVLREIKEETGAPATIIRFIGVYSSPGYQTYHYNNRSVQYVTSCFEAKFTEAPDMAFGNQETSELKFFPTDQVPRELAMINPEWLRDALQKCETPFLR